MRLYLDNIRLKLLLLPHYSNTVASMSHCTDLRCFRVFSVIWLPAVFRLSQNSIFHYIFNSENKTSDSECQALIQNSTYTLAFKKWSFLPVFKYCKSVCRCQPVVKYSKHMNALWSRADTDPLEIKIMYRSYSPKMAEKWTKVIHTYVFFVAFPWTKIVDSWWHLNTNLFLTWDIEMILCLTYLVETQNTSECNLKDKQANKNNPKTTTNNNKNNYTSELMALHYLGILSFLYLFSGSGKHKWSC